MASDAHCNRNGIKDYYWSELGLHIFQVVQNSPVLEGSRLWSSAPLEWGPSEEDPIVLGSFIVRTNSTRYPV